MDARISFSNLGASQDTDFVHVTYTGRKKDAVISAQSAGCGRNASPNQSSIGLPKSTDQIQKNKRNGSQGVMKRPQFNSPHCSYSSAFSIEKPEDEEKEAKSLILVRCDFKKSVKEHPYYPALTPFNRSTSLMNYFKEEQNCTLKESNSSKKYLQSKGMSLRRDSDKTDQIPNNFEADRNNADSEGQFPRKPADTCDVAPESPESRKKDFCSYLQLMNPADKKEVYILQNRRSTRVRNLAVMQKQKQLQVELTETVAENGAIQESPKELIVKINQQDGETTHDHHEHFYFPFPPEHLMKTIQDFDIVMSKVGPRLKRMCKYKNIKLLTDDTEMQSQISEKNSITPVREIEEPSEAEGVKTLETALKKTVQRKKLAGKKTLHSDRTNSLRSKKDAKISSWKTLKRKELRESLRACREKSETGPSQCEIVTVPFAEDTNDLEHFLDDMVDFNSLSEEHRRCLIESRIFAAQPPPVDDASRLRSISPLYGFSKTDASSKDLDLLKNTGKEVTAKSDTPLYGNNTYLILNFHGAEPQQAGKEKKVVLKENQKKSEGTSLSEHDYAGHPNKKKSETNDVDVETVPLKNMHVGYLEVNTKYITKKNKFEILPHNKSSDMKSLHRSLQFDKKAKNDDNLAVDAALAHEWAGASPKQKSKKQSHSIAVRPENGAVLKAFYVDNNLIVCQEYVVSFWMQTPLGHVLGSQDMWVPRGHTQRLVLSNKCTQKDSMEKVVSVEASVVYVELWMKEHKSEMRQGPVADVFVALYFWKQRQNGLDKKVLQLENINGFADDVQYSVMKTTPKIIVSWHSANEDTASKRTFIHAYLLAADFQTVSNVYDIEPVDHYVSSLHNIEDCDSLIMGCGENKITLWNVEFGYVVATIELSDIKSPLSTLWVKCDRGFLFALQQCVDRELRLVAINGMNHSWKKLASYLPPEGFDRLRGVSLENGLLISFYDQGILCWKAETGEPVDEICLENDAIPSGKYVILFEENQIVVKHVVTHLMSVSVDES